MDAANGPDNTMVWWRRMAKNRLIDIGLTAIVVLAAWKIVSVLPHQLEQFDFAHFYTWSTMLREGDNPYTHLQPEDYTKRGFRFQPETPAATYTPVLLRLFSPLTLLPPETAFPVWVGAQLASLVAVLWLTWRLLCDRISARGMYFICAATVASTSIYHHFISSQVQLQITVLLLLAFLWHRSGKDTLACLIVATAGLVKLFPFVLLPWFLWRGQGTLTQRLTRCGLVAGFVALGVVATDIHLWSDFLGQSAPVLTHWARHHLFNYSVPSFVLHIGYAANHFEATIEATRLWWMAGVAIGLGIIALGYAWCLRATGNDDDAQFSLLCCAMLAGMPTVWEHYFVVLVFPLALAAVRVAARPTGLRVLWFAAILTGINNLSTADLVFDVQGQWLAILWNYTPVYAVLALGTLFVVEGRQRGTLTARDTTGTTSSTPPRP